MEKEEQQNPPKIRLAEIERLIDVFEEDFKSKTSDADDFITIHEIERMWGDLQQNTLNIYSDMVRELLSKVDERDLIRKKTRVFPKRNKTAVIYESASFSHNHTWLNILFKISFEACESRKQRKADRAYRLKKCCSSRLQLGNSGSAF